ncbi:MAG: cytochrome c family protein [Alphaproteobacteria bacterium]|nr:cytochrome c family protein [Alphaproteobacteria bacterium]
MRGCSTAVVFVGSLSIWLAGLSPGVLAAGDAAHGAQVFKQCLICHTNEAGKNKIGPSLFGIIGRPSASVPNFNYSPAMKAFNKVWTDELLKEYEPDPQKMVPGTKMSFPGLKNPQDVDDVIAYLNTLK